MRTLEDIIVSHIALHGPMPVETYWNLCLYHPEQGYYSKRDPLGAAGDFVTAPEISQLFGEMIGVWAAERWEYLGRPSKIHLLECGAGRGTLMADLLRVAVMVPDFAQALHVHILETSPALRARQRETVKWPRLEWHEDLSTVPDDEPLLIVGNEFLDALPVRQFVFSGGGWRERVVRYEEGEGFFFCAGGSVRAADMPDVADEGAVLEISPAREKVMEHFAERIKVQGGAILMIDYGYDLPQMIETMQAVGRHQFADILENQGEVDLTSHVDFVRLRHQLKSHGFCVSVSNQRDFLLSVGIMQRAGQLRARADNAQGKELDAGLRRLLDPDQMGHLFKVIEVTA